MPILFRSCFSYNGTCIICLHRKVEQVCEEAESFRTGLDRHQAKVKKRVQETQERAELLGRAVWSPSEIWEHLSLFCVLELTCLVDELLLLYIEWGFACFKNFWWGSTGEGICEEIIQVTRGIFFNWSCHTFQVQWTEGSLKGIYVDAPANILNRKYIDLSAHRRT